jgi:hypothetical protein
VAVEIVNRSASPTNETSLPPAGVPGSGSAPQSPVDSGANKQVASQKTEEATTSSKEAAPTAEAANSVAREEEKGDKNKKKKSGLRKIFRF